MRAFHISKGKCPVLFLHFSMITDGYPPGITRENFKIKITILLVLDVVSSSSSNALPYTNGI
jgi:hypothetical protein